uniref:Uncharacterized protein n=1 Tax=Chromera velia CCMP2878 TaxID=1169474 RepID=A0A0G4HHW6_9ALVE|eukprot:Cvel_6869.t1-p1 / transcript=Cvel_6869.t1 / gene=Cvel_6869 / organism=Chromera_velia_CCMP2878 / gene_product=hypothetical protein / transcript_product=hypothetical protein / location=Cvel_scaffold347:28347-30988(+) / protein_length=358 / sequence_SO=supercontig / SO=protein_coding / is_pseudo=false
MSSRAEQGQSSVGVLQPQDSQVPSAPLKKNSSIESEKEESRAAGSGQFIEKIQNTVGRFLYDAWDDFANSAKAASTHELNFTAGLAAPLLEGVGKVENASAGRGDIGSVLSEVEGELGDTVVSNEKESLTAASEAFSGMEGLLGKIAEDHNEMLKTEPSPSFPNETATHEHKKAGLPVDFDPETLEGFSDSFRTAGMHLHTHGENSERGPSREGNKKEVKLRNQKGKLTSALPGAELLSSPPAVPSQGASSSFSSLQRETETLAVLPPGYEDELLCPPGYCLKPRKMPAGFAGPRSVFHVCIPVAGSGGSQSGSSGTSAETGTLPPAEEADPPGAIPVTPSGPRLAQQRPNGYHSTPC